MPEVEPADPEQRRGAAAGETSRARTRRRSRSGSRCSTASASRRSRAPTSGETGGWLGLRERPRRSTRRRSRCSPTPGFRRRGRGSPSSPPAPTIDLTVHFRAPLPLADSLLLGRFRSSLVRDGFFDEDGELWTPDGTLVAQSRQLGLLLGASV